MRIALVSHYMPPHTGGVEQVAALLARVYADAGHEVTWVACAAPESAGVSAAGPVKLIRLPALNVLESRFAMPFPLLAPSGFARIDEIVRSSDVVHMHDCLYTTSLAADRAAGRRHVPALVTQHVGMATFGGGLLDPLLYAAYRLVGRGVLRRARRVAFVSPAVRRWFLAQVAPDLRAEDAPNAIDTERFRPASPAERATARDALGIPPGRPLVVFAGRLVPVKNVGLLAAAVVAADASLLVAGDGPERGALAHLGVRVTHLPRVAHERMPEIYRAADVFALPSSREAMPVSLMEALASGLPCLLSRDRAFDPLSACEGVVRSELTHAALSAALAGLLAEDAADRSRRCDAARAWAERNYGLGPFAERYLRLLGEAAGA